MREGLDTFAAFAATYGSLDDAEADHEAIKSRYYEGGLIDTFDAAVITRDDKGRVKIVKKHEQRSRPTPRRSRTTSTHPALRPDDGSLRSSSSPTQIARVCPRDGRCCWQELERPVCSPGLPASEPPPTGSRSRASR